MSQASQLPAPLVDALEQLGTRLRGRGGTEAEVPRAIELLNALPPQDVATVGREIADLAGLHHHYPGIIDALVARLRLGPAYRARLNAMPGLEWIFLFHRDGFAREAALDRVQGPIPSPFLAAALAYRLNDWVPEVRKAAAGAVARSFAASDAGTLAVAALFLLDRGRLWQRWQAEEAALTEALSRPDIADRLALEIGRRPQGPMARVLVSVLRGPTLDRHLPALAGEAVQPAVRAVALAALISGKVRWPTGSERRWIDKSMGIMAWVPVYSERAVERHSPPERLILQGLRDRSAAVRKAGLSGVIALGRIPAEVLPLVRALAADASRGVRAKAEFALQQAGTPVDSEI